jgi:hypothetical protein
VFYLLWYHCADQKSGNFAKTSAPLQKICQKNSFSIQELQAFSYHSKISQLDQPLQFVMPSIRYQQAKIQMTDPSYSYCD